MSTAKPTLESMVVPKGDSELDVARLEAEAFSYQLLVPQPGLQSSGPLLSEAYACWRSVWIQTLRELDAAERVFSDDFTRQHELGALFYRDRCVGLTGYRWVDLRLRASREDSYFKVWPSALLDQISSTGECVCVGSNLTVLPEWRRTVDGYSIKELLMVLAVKRFLASDAGVMVGTMRNDRGMNGLVYRLGARAMLQDVTHHGVQVDLVTFDRRALGPIEPRPAVDVLSQRLWRDCWEGTSHERRVG